MSVSTHSHPKVAAPMFPTLSSLNQEIRIIGVARERVETL